MVSDVSLRWPEGSRVLVVGVGGGSDGLVAYVIARRLAQPGVVFYVGNTKRRVEPDVLELSPHVFCLPDGEAPETHRHGSTDLDRRIPRDFGDPLILCLPDRQASEALAKELGAMSWDAVVAVDTGGDVLTAIARGRVRKGRDAQMLEVLGRVGVPITLVVVSPGSDGALAGPDALATLSRVTHPQMRSLGTWRWSEPDATGAPWWKLLAHVSLGIGDKRTPRIISDAMAGDAERVQIPREQRPVLERDWLDQILLWHCEPGFRVAPRRAAPP